MGNWEHQVQFGVTTPGGPCATEQIDAVTTLLDRVPQYLLWYQDFASTPPGKELDAAGRLGAYPVITWEPWTGADRGPDTMRRLASGALDEYVHEWITTLRDWQRPVYLRFAHEFNGDWYPWSPAGGTPPDAYLSTWRRVHDICTDTAATNVQWMWCADAGGPHQKHLLDWYPGDEFVDCFGVDGYNWGTSQPGTSWREAADILDNALAQTVGLADGRPVLISEAGCAESGGSKPNWIISFVDYVRRHPAVAGFIWFDHDKETDWRIGSTPQSAAAMRSALRERR
ncbi:MAG: glycoside hydrolase family 26 protein [Mycobacterium sp.]